MLIIPVTGLLTNLALVLAKFLFKVGIRGLAIRILVWAAKRSIFTLSKITKLSSTEITGLLRNTIISRLKDLGVPYRVFIKSAPKGILDLLRFHRLKPNLYRVPKTTLRKVEDFEAKKKLGLIKTTTIGRFIVRIFTHPWFWIFTWVNVVDWIIWPVIMSRGRHSLFDYIRFFLSGTKEDERRKTAKVAGPLTIRAIDDIVRSYRHNHFTKWFYPPQEREIEINRENTIKMVKWLNDQLILEGKKPTPKKIYELLTVFASYGRTYEEMKELLPPEEVKKLKEKEKILPGETEEPFMEPEIPVPKVPVEVRPKEKVIPPEVERKYRFVTKYFKTVTDTWDNIIELIDGHYPEVRRRLETEVGYQLKRDPEIRYSKLPSRTNAKTGRRGLRITFNQDKLTEENIDYFKTVVLYHELVHCLLLQYAIGYAYVFAYHERLHENLAFFLSGEPHRAEILKKIPLINREKVLKIMQLWIAYRLAGDSTGKAREKAVIEVTGKSWYEWRGYTPPRWVYRTRKRRIPKQPEIKPIEPFKPPVLPPFADAFSPYTGDTLRIPQDLLVSGAIVKDPQVKKPLKVIFKDGVLRLKVVSDIPEATKIKFRKPKLKLPEVPKERVEERLTEDIIDPAVGVKTEVKKFVRLVSPWTGKEILIPIEKMRPGTIFIDKTSGKRMFLVIEKGKWKLIKITETPKITPPSPVRKVPPEIKRELKAAVKLKKAEEKETRPVMEIKRTKEREGRLRFTAKEKAKLAEAAKRIAEIRRRLMEIKRKVLLLKRR